MSVKSFLKDVFTNKNNINENNIIMLVTTIMLVAIDIVALCKKVDVFYCILVAEHLLFLFCMNKTENSELEVKDVLKTAENITIESIKQ